MPVLKCFVRKKGHGNTYKSDDSYNLIDWSRKAIFSYVSDYFKKLIQIRKKHPAFRMTSTKQIQKHLRFNKDYMPGVVAYELINSANGDKWNHIQVIFNNNPEPIIYPIKKGNWTEIVNGYAIDEQGINLS